jgi:hypothetical protein
LADLAPPKSKVDFLPFASSFQDGTEWVRFYSIRKNIYLITNIIDSQTGLCSDSACPAAPGEPSGPNNLAQIIWPVREEQAARPDVVVDEWDGAPPISGQKQQTAQQAK